MLQLGIGFAQRRVLALVGFILTVLAYLLVPAQAGAQGQQAPVPAPLPVPSSPPAALSQAMPSTVPATRQLVPVMQLTAPQIQSLVAGIALYQDGLLSMMFLASAYPADLEQAQLLLPTLSGMNPDQAAGTIQLQNWDPAVKALLSFPAVLAMMATQPDWTRQIGDLYRFRSVDLMQAVQALRKQALQQGALKSGPQIQVLVDSQGLVLINPVDQQVIFVPQYNPTVVYGRWMYPSYPPYPIYNPGWGSVAFGVGIAAGAVIWTAPHWRTGVVVLNRGGYNSFVSRYGYVGGVRSGGWAHGRPHGHGHR